MRQILPTTMIMISVLGCSGKNSQTEQDSARLSASPATSSSKDVDEYAEKWKAAARQERQGLADLSKVTELFLGADKETIEQALGPADQSGIDDFGMDVMRYELGTMKDMDGVKAHLTFVFEKGVVTSVMGNSISF